MRLAKDTRATLGLAIEALIELLDAVGPDPDEEPALGNPERVNQEYAWDINAGARDNRENEHDGAEPDVDDESSLGAFQTHEGSGVSRWVQKERKSVVFS